MKYIGFFVIILAAVFLSREYSRYMRKRLAECEGFLAFFCHIRIQVGCFLRPWRELAADFRSDALSASGFLSALKSSPDVYCAYKSVENKLSLSSAEKSVADALFASVGNCYLDDEIRLIDDAADKMERCVQKLRTECPKNIKLVSSLSITAALGFFILLL